MSTSCRASGRARATATAATRSWTTGRSIRLSDPWPIYEAVAAGLRAEGISVCVDLVLNHTAREHEWARKAREGSARHQAYYLMFDSREMPERYEESLLEVFPAHAPGNFTCYPDFGKWVWTTFNEHQWDLELGESRCLP